MKFVKTIGYISILGFSQLSLAGGLRKESAHTHGQSQMNIVLEAKNLQLEWIVPADDLFGFEHKPKNEEEKKQVKEALAKLKDPGLIVEFSKSAACRLKEHVINSGGFEEVTDHHDKGHKKGSSDHHDDHDKAHKRAHDHHDKGHKKANDHHDHHHDDHQDMIARWTFDCEKPASFKEADFKVHRSFSHVKKIRLQAIVHGMPTSTDLNAEKTMVKFPAAK